MSSPGRSGRPSGRSFGEDGPPPGGEPFARDDLQPLTLKRYVRGAAAVTPMPVVAATVVTIAADLQAGRPGGVTAGRQTITGRVAPSGHPAKVITTGA